MYRSSLPETGNVALTGCSNQPMQLPVEISFTLTIGCQIVYQHAANNYQSLLADSHAKYSPPASTSKSPHGLTNWSLEFNLIAYNADTSILEYAFGREGPIIDSHFLLKVVDPHHRRQACPSPRDASRAKLRIAPPWRGACHLPSTLSLLWTGLSCFVF